MLPNFVCVGAQKSGTTTLAHLLERHPDVCMARPRETRFFSEPTRFAEGLPAYELRHFPHWRNERAVGEKCPEYLYLPEVPARLRAALGGDLRVLVSLRSPARRAYSHYRHNVARLREVRPFEEALEGEAAIEAAGGFVAPPFGYLGRGRYAEQLRRYRDAFGAARCLVLSFGAMVEDQRALAREVFAFLGVDPSAPTGEPVHAGRPPLEQLHVGLHGTGTSATVQWVQRGEGAARGPRAWVRRLLGRAVPPFQAGHVRRPSPALQAFVRDLTALRPLPPALSRSDELRLNHRYFAGEREALQPLVPFDVAPWWDGASDEGAS